MQIYNICSTVCLEQCINIYGFPHKLCYSENHFFPEIFEDPCINPDVLLQQQQYPHLPEDQVKYKAVVWKTYDEKEQERGKAFYQDILAQQQLVSPFYTYVRLYVHQSDLS